eukprot:4194517-Pleurochrysis_carterae.AAC.2
MESGRNGHRDAETTRSTDKAADDPLTLCLLIVDECTYSKMWALSVCAIVFWPRLCVCSELERSPCSIAGIHIHVRALGAWTWLHSHFLYCTPMLD